MADTANEYVIANKSDLVSVADAIRQKTGGVIFSVFLIC